MSGAIGGSKSQQSTFIDPAQAPFLQSLRQGGQSLQQQLQPQFQQLGQFGQQLGQQGQGFVNQLGQAGQGLNQFISPQGTQGQIDAATNTAQSFLDRNLNTNRGNANLLGGFGGGRQAVARGAATGEASVGLGQLVADIEQQDIFRRQQAAGLQGQLGVEGALGGLQGLGSIFELLNSGLLGQFGGLQQQAGLVGGPTTLGQGSSFAVQASGGGKAG